MAPPTAICGLHFTPQRKAEICALILKGEAGFAATLMRYELSAEELQGWLDRYQRNGHRGLRVSDPKRLRN